jgi:hypothetical protein
MGYKMKGSPMHSGTAAHKSALKMAEKSPAKDTKEYGPYSYSHNKKHQEGLPADHKPVEKTEPAPTKQGIDPDQKFMKEAKPVEKKMVLKKRDGVKKKRMMKKELKPVLKEQEEAPQKRMMKKELKTLKKPKAKHWNEKLTKLTNKRKKLKTKQDKREDEDKGTKIIDFRVKRNQKRINKEYKKVGN